MKIISFIDQPGICLFCKNIQSTIERERERLVSIVYLFTLYYLCSTDDTLHRLTIDVYSFTCVMGREEDLTFFGGFWST